MLFIQDIKQNPNTQNRNYMDKAFNLVTVSLST